MFAHPTVQTLYCAWSCILLLCTSSALQVMDTASLPGADPKTSLHNIVSIRSSTKPNVIQDYKFLVKTMVGLMLSLGREGSSPAGLQDLKSAANSLVSLPPQPIHALPL